METPLWMFKSLPESNSLVGIDIRDWGVRERVLRNLPTGAALLRTGKDTFMVGGAWVNWLDSLSSAIANGLVTRALGVPLLFDAVAVSTRASEAGPVASFRMPSLGYKILEGNVDRFCEFVCSILRDIADIPARAGILSFSLAAPYRSPAGAVFSITNPFDDFDAKEIAGATLPIDSAASFLRVDASISSDADLLYLFRLLRRCRATEYRIMSESPDARDLEIESKVKQIFESISLPEIPAVALRYCSRSIFSAKIGTAAMGEVFKIAALISSKNPEKADHYILNDPISCFGLSLNSFAFPCGNNTKAPDTNVAIRAFFSSLLAPFGLSDRVYDVIAGLQARGVPALAGMYVAYCITLAASAALDISFLQMVYSSGPIKHGLDLALLLSNGGGIEDIRKSALRLLEGLIDPSGHRHAVAINDDGSLSSSGDNEEHLDIVTVLRDCLLSCSEGEDDEKIRHIANDVAGRIGASTNAGQVFPLLMLLQVMRVQSQFLFTGIFNAGATVSDICGTRGYEADLMSPLRIVLCKSVESRALENVVEAAATLCGSKTEMPSFQAVVKETDQTWRSFLFPESALDKSTDWFGFL